MSRYYCKSCGCVWHIVIDVQGGYKIIPHYRYDPEGAAERPKGRQRTQGILSASDIWDADQIPCEGGKIDIDKDRAP